MFEDKEDKEDKEDDLDKDNLDTFKKKLINTLKFAYENPSCLIIDEKEEKEEKEYKIILEKLIGKTKGNKPTNQEICFAKLLEKNDFLFSHKPDKKKNKEEIKEDKEDKEDKEEIKQEGYLYIYQPNGTQRSPDFSVGYYKDGIKVSEVLFDLKSTSSKKIYLNDGWFEEDIVYMITYRIKKKDFCLISFGKYIPTPVEIEAKNKIDKIKKQFNTEFNTIENFHIYFRFANTYNIDGRLDQNKEKIYKDTIDNILL